MHDVETLWADFTRPITTADGSMKTRAPSTGLKVR